MDSNIFETHTPECITVFYYVPGELGSGQASISNMGDHWCFNRLVVHQRLRGQGIATKLMGRLTETLDRQQILLVNDVNPYGDLSFQQLIRFYKKFGFVETDTPGRLVRYPCCAKQIARDCPTNKELL